MSMNLSDLNRIMVVGKPTPAHPFTNLFMQIDRLLLSKQKYTSINGSVGLLLYVNIAECAFCQSGEVEVL